MTYTKFHENLPEGWWSSRHTGRDNFRELPLTTSTVAVKLGRHGVIVLILISLFGTIYLNTAKIFSLLEYKFLYTKYIPITYTGWRARRGSRAAL